MNELIKELKDLVNEIEYGPVKNRINAWIREHISVFQRRMLINGKEISESIISPTSVIEFYHQELIQEVARELPFELSDSNRLKGFIEVAVTIVVIK